MSFRSRAMALIQGGLETIWMQIKEKEIPEIVQVPEPMSSEFCSVAKLIQEEIFRVVTPRTLLRSMLRANRLCLKIEDSSEFPKSLEL